MKEKKELDIHIGQQIKKIRELSGYTQERFAEVIGMGTKNVSAIERGVVGISLLTFKKICQTMYVSSDTLLMEEPDGLDVEKLNVFVGRLKHLSTQQLELVFDINNKLFEIFALQNSDNE